MRLAEVSVYLRMPDTTMGNKAADIVFLFPPGQGNLGAFRNHLGVAYLRAALARDGFLTTQYLNPNPGTVREIAEEVLHLGPRLVGFTVYDANFALSIALAGALKRRRPEVQVVFGGPSASFCAQEILARQPDVDACVLGEAEETGAGIFTWLLDGHADDSVPQGLAIRCDGEVVAPRMPPLVGTRDMPLEAQSMLDVTPSPYLAGALEDGRPGVLTGRGCTHHCQYCCFAALGRKKLRLHSIDRVLAELEWIAAHQERTGEHYLVPIHDDAFTLLPSRAKLLCQAIADRKLDLLLSCITRADTVDEELLQLMQEAGFVSLAFGLESAVPSVLRATGKVRPPDFHDPDLSPELEFIEKVRTSVVNAKKHRINVGVSIILGLPTETAEDAATTLAFVKKLPVDFYMHNFLWVFPGTPLWDSHQQYGISCTINSMGLAATTGYAYDLAKLRPRPNCSMEEDARVMRMLAVDSLSACAGPSTEAGVSAAVLEAAELIPRTAAWLAGILDVGSILVQVYPPLTRCQEQQRVFEDQCRATDCLVPVRHHVQMLPRKSHDGNERWILACSGSDLYCKHKPQLVTLTTSDCPAPFLEWLRRKPGKCDVCDVTELLWRPHDILRIVKEVGEDGLGAHLRCMPAAPGLMYPGRWLGSKAPCLSLSRIEIDAEGRVRPCRQAEPIGNIGDDRRTLAVRLKALADEAERRRGCHQCPATHCPRCPFPGLKDAAYCSILRKRARPLGFLYWAHLYSRVPSILYRLRDKLGGD